MLDRRARRAVAQRLVDPGRVEREVLADAARVHGDARVLADEVLLVVGDRHVPVDRLEDALPGDRRLALERRRERVAEVLRDVLQRPDVEVRGGVFDGVLEISAGDSAHRARFLCRGSAGTPAEDAAFQKGVAHHAVAAVRAAGDLAARVGLRPSSAIRVDRESAVLVVEDGVCEDLLRERIDAGAAVAAQHVWQRDLRIGLRDPRRVEVDRGPAVLGLDALALRDLVEDRLADLVPRAERVGELLAVGVQEHGAVGTRRLRDR